MGSKKRRVGFIGIGVQKAGTTWIHANLDAHPSLLVASGKDKDTRFFTCFYDRGYQWYESNFSEGSGLLAGEVSTSYFYDSDAPARIKSYNPGGRLFVCLRNPVERIISNHRHEARLGHISGDNLDLGIALRNNPAYILQSSYATHLERWYRYFDPSQLCVLFFDDLINDPVTFMSGLYAFLGVNNDFIPEAIESKANVSRMPASRGIENAIVRAGKGLRGLGFGRLVSAGRKLGFNDWMRTVNTVRDEASVLVISDEAKARIAEMLRPEIVQLGELTGHDVSRWLV